MSALSPVFRACVCALSILCAALGITVPASAQEDFFKPKFEAAAPTKKPQAPEPQIFSFQRFEGDFTVLCTELEGDGRRERLVKIAEAGVVRERECITCRSFWKMVVSACSRLGPRPTPKPKPTKKTKTQKSGKEEPPSEESAAPPTEATDVQEESGDESVREDTPIPPTPTKGPKQERYPSVALINEASRVSTAVYSLDSGDGQVAKTFQYFAKTVRETPDMSSAEREYYDIFLTYLLAAWDGRVDKTKLPPPTPPASLRDFFE